jgi:hypothetical protein
MAAVLWSSLMGKFVVLGASALLTLASVGGAFAQEAVATAKNEPAQAVQPPPPPPGAIARIDAPGDDADAAPQTRMGFCGPMAVGRDGRPDTSAHGNAGVAVGTHGYQAYHFAVCKPLGKDGNSGVAISVDKSQFGRR